MTNEQAAKHFASLPPEEEARIIIIWGDTSMADSVGLNEPGTHIEEVEEEFRQAGDGKHVTIILEW